MDDYDLYALFVAACLAGGHSPNDAIREANTTLDLFRDVMDDKADQDNEV